MLKPLSELKKSLASGATSSRALVDECLARIADPKGEGSRTFTKVYADAARAAADAADAQRKAGIAPGPLAGIPVSIKDLLDVTGDVTMAGSRVARHAKPATADAPVVQRLRAAGAVIIGRTNMTEFAYSGLGLNPHYGTPQNPYQRNATDPKRGRIPGGSSSGAAISVTDGMAAVGIGTDTGGSIRIPAAFNGLTGFKPTSIRVPRAGALPLSTTLDSIGPLASNVACCALVDAVLSGNEAGVPALLPLAGLRLGVVKGFVLDGLDEQVGKRFEAAVVALSAAGARVSDVTFAELDNIPGYMARGAFSAPEAYHWHRHWLRDHYAEYDPRVSGRMMKGGEILAWEYLELIEQRRRTLDSAHAAFAGYDAWLLPSVAMIAPVIADTAATDEGYTKANVLALRNTSAFNFLDCCGLSIPVHRPGEAPVGLMVAGLQGCDARILALGQSIEAALGAAGCAIPG
jgi:aspartyl-tRNA(Asn)/glutamyl-tRNA(Gln) amidotransferase subunit A